MNADPPNVSIIIPTRPGEREVLAVQAGRRLRYSEHRLEVLLAQGRQPAVQRNVALRQAKGELVYFLDDDVDPAPENLEIARRHFEDPKVVMVGGPNLCPQDAPWLEQVFAVVLSSALAFGPSRARYDAVGSVRATGEKELILCNLMARRQALLDVGGFDEALYPNEENALMDALQKKGGCLIYDPKFVAWRRPRPTLPAFLLMLWRYGRGRAEQFRRHPTPGSVLNFVPPLFCVYLASGAWVWLGWWGAAPLGLYGLAVVGQTGISMVRKGFWRSLAAAPLLVATHIFYGLGFWRGLATRWSKSPVYSSQEVVLDKIQ